MEQNHIWGGGSKALDSDKGAATPENSFIILSIYETFFSKKNTKSYDAGHLKSTFFAEYVYMYITTAT